MDDPQPTPVSNMPEYTVSEISGAVKRTLETTFGRVRVRGELTAGKSYPPAHHFLSLRPYLSIAEGRIVKNFRHRLEKRGAPPWHGPGKRHRGHRHRSHLRIR